MKKLNGLDWASLVLVIIGGLNWLLISLFNFNIVGLLLGEENILSRIIYGLVGLAAIYLIFISGKLTRA
ncbi:MAG: DUF378 domain-containing protein [bacterium]|nr:DUF378 domain-containing protein [bacterium]